MGQIPKLPHQRASQFWFNSFITSYLGNGTMRAYSPGMNPRLLLFTLLTFVGMGGFARAGQFTFSFYGLTDTNNGANNNAAIASYMDGILGCVSCVTVTGAAVDESYNADGNTVGPNGVPDTLGNTTNAAG